MRYVLIKRSDGGCSCRLLYNDDADPATEVAGWEAKPKVIERGWSAISWEVVDADPRSDVDRYFRGAWEASGADVSVVMSTARTIHMDHIRPVRDEKLAELDLAYIRADEQGDDVERARIAQEKQVLRDIPQTFDMSGYTTPETLKAAWPSELDRRRGPR